MRGVLKQKRMKSAVVTVTLIALVYHFLPTSRVHRSTTWQPMASFRLAASGDVISDQDGVSSKRQHVGNGVPRIIHQTWRGVQLPEMLQPWLESWVRVHPNWEYWFWTDDDLQRFIAAKYPQFVTLFQGYPSNGYRADVFRFVLYSFAPIIL